ncbi:polar amino acid transport system substrate-binding protein [Atopomonas hussainii]|uniref:Polar amino acid transport system substrate-binding protein n=1 Tax=Atopomonas hussainii TaxID=1429083 RepID=A0A1H7GMB9_9GAMM|nr:transporter substrate-binding domain-containing protein [Atopomonas hussainii]SEK39293.1 polar amino acid transport system substrate-binding protein [Atopomonas hussainii]
MRMSWLGWVSFVLVMPGYAEQQTVTISTGEFPPFTSADLPHGGVVNQLVQEAFAAQGYWVAFHYLPWQRAKREARAGRLQASSYWQCNAENEKDFLCSSALKHEQYVFFYHKSKPLPDWQNFADLRPYRLGATAGYSYSHEFWLAAETGLLQVELVQEDEQNIAKLLRGRIDGLLLDPMVAYDILARRFAPGTAHLLEYHPKPVVEMTGHLLISRKVHNAQELLGAFEAGLSTLKANGRFEELWDAMLQPQDAPAGNGAP